MFITVETLSCYLCHVNQNKINKKSTFFWSLNSLIGLCLRYCCTYRCILCKQYEVLSVKLVHENICVSGKSKIFIFVLSYLKYLVVIKYANTV